MTSLRITDDIDSLVRVFPADISSRLYEADRFEDLVEVIMDLGRPCEARYTDVEVLLTEREINQSEIDSVVDAIGSFGDDNRAGIERTLHRISAIRNRHGNVIGLTCRVGRAVYGTIDIIRDIVESGKSVLLLGRPGVGKTTMLREVARVLAEKKRVVIVDTSNEIGGDGDIPHPAVGRARRMQVMTPSLQHAVMIEAVENHMPQVIVIDEIGTELEAAAARTIAERGVQLVGTAHGNTLDNLMRNPTLNDLVGGIQTVTLSDDEARRRGTQKSVLERKAPPTFDIVVEIQERERVAIRQDVTEAVDAILRGRSLPVTVRVRRPNGEIESIDQEPERDAARASAAQHDRQAVSRRLKKRSSKVSPLRIYPYGLNQTRIKQTGRHLGLPVVIVNDLLEADALFTLRTYYRKRPPIVSEAERKGIPIYVLRNNTAEQIESYLVDLFALERSPEEDTLSQALEEAQLAINQVNAGEKTSVQLVPRSSYVRRMQHQLIRESDLLSRSSGVEPRRRVTVYRGN